MVDVNEQVSEEDDNEEKADGALVESPSLGGAFEKLVIVGMELLIHVVVVLRALAVQHWLCHFNF